MRLRCPQCQVAIELVASESATDLSCPSCGASVDSGPVGDRTVRRVPVGRQVAHYTLHERLGRGAFGAVWKAYDDRLDRYVALKIPRDDQFDAETFQHFVREAQAAAQVKHSQIVTIFEIGHHDDIAYIASELVEGASLQQLLKERTFSPRESAALIASSAEGVHAAHEAGVIHRDLKPGNILLDHDLQPHITDFGLAKREAEITVTLDGQVLGTLNYMSPEQAGGNSRDADRRSDVYSLGVVLYELLCGRRPFEGSRGHWQLHQIQHLEPPSPRSLVPSVPQDLATICLKALQKLPGDRYQTAAELAADLRRFLAGQPIHARRSSPLERARRWCVANATLAATLALVVVLSIAVAVLVVRSRWPTARPLAAGREDHSDAASVARRKVVLSTVPAGAQLYFHRLDPQSGEPLPGETVEAAGNAAVQVELPPGDYLVVAVPRQAGYSFHEVFRRVPAAGETPYIFRHNRWTERSGGEIELPPIEFPREQSLLESMCRFEGAEAMVVGSATLSTSPRHVRRIPAFWLDAHEVTAGKVRALEPRHSAISYYAGERGSDPPAELALGYFSWDDAVQFAEQIGKRLPDEWEFEFAATLGGTRQFPWGEKPPELANWEGGPAGQPAMDRLPTQPAVFGLFSNVAEWTSSRAGVPPGLNTLPVPADLAKSHRIVRGAPASIARDRPSPAAAQVFDPRERIGIGTFTWRRTVGLRCARSLKPRTRTEDFGRLAAP